MGRPKSYEADSVVTAAGSAFWSQGYAQCSIDQLEAVTGLSRSSLYHGFGTKRDLFDAALEDYLLTITTPTLAPVEAEGPPFDVCVDLFRSLAAGFRKRGAGRGCLMINSIAELGGREASFEKVASAYVDRLRAAFSNVLEGGVRRGVMDSRQATERAELLTSALLGAWLVVRVDAKAAAVMCDAIANEAAGWAENSIGVGR
jgi:AcrR family transcriptional regulator